jgi:hypothetical protein
MRKYMGLLKAEGIYLIFMKIVLIVIAIVLFGLFYQWDQ